MSNNDNAYLFIYYLASADSGENDDCSSIRSRSAETVEKPDAFSIHEHIDVLANFSPLVNNAIERTR